MKANNDLKYALVTGTDHGVGLELARELLKREYFVFACRIDENEHLIDNLKQDYQEQLEIINCNIASDESVKEMARLVSEKAPYIDLLINDAGILGDMEKILGDALDYAEIARVINVNAIGTLRVTNALSKMIIDSKDKTVINISSEAGSVADCWREGWFGYGMSKAANNMQSAMIHNTLRKLGGKVLVFHPGYVATYMRGHLDTTAQITADVSAKGILHQALDLERPIMERPEYIDYAGQPLRW